jgi:tetratricopeptide (TPR) repeat protein
MKFTKEIFLSICVLFFSSTLYSQNYLQQGIAKLDSKEYKEAIELLIKAVVQNLESSRTHYHLGEAYFFAEDTNNAITSFSKAIELDIKYGETSDLRDIGEKQPRVLKKPEAVYPEAVKEKGLEGKVIVNIIFSADSLQAKGVEILGSDNEIFEAAAIEAAMNALYVPAINTKLGTRAPLKVLCFYNFKPPTEGE